MNESGAVKASVRIIADTTAVLPADYVAAHGLAVVPQVIIFGEESFLENEQITTEEFIRRLKGSSQLPKTAAPPPGRFIEAYRQELERARALVGIFPSGEVSGTVRSALTAREEAFPGADIRIVDTRTIGAGLGGIVRAAVSWAESGLDASEIVRRVDEMIPRCRTYFLIRTLEYLQKGGRIGGAAALMGSVLQIKPILQLKDGRIEVLEKVRVHSKAVERLIELTVEECPRTPESYLGVMHADNLEQAERLAADLARALGMAEVPIYNVGAAITTHGGPGILGVGFFA